jgi:ADP-dependent NAD(P)H-hydrate dehydratase
MSEEIISVTPDLIHDLIPPRLVSSKKGDNGIVLVVGGSGIYHGAPLLSTLAALRSGVDLVYTAVPKSNIVPTRSFSPNVIVLPLPTDRFTIGSAKQLIKILPKKPDVVAIGMGMAIEKPEYLVYMVKELKRMGTKLLLDASALIPEILEHISGSNTVITPHPGEYKRLFQKEKNYEEIMNTRTTNTVTIQEQTSNVCKLARKYGITIILKGYDNIICNGGIKNEQEQQQQSIAVIKRTTPAMTVGGCGDVLSGVVAGLFAKMQDAFSASVAAVYFSGMAADLAYQRVGLHMVATDIIDELPNAIKPFDKIE